MQKPKVIAIAGPTASGKTSLSIKVAKEISGEIISVDSRQIYRGLDIGTGKVLPEEMDGIPHHLLDVADIDETYTITDFERDASTAITSILAREHVPICAGGTFFWLDALRGRTGAAPVPPNPSLRAKLEELSTTELFARLEEADPKRAAAIDKMNRRRLIRALEIIAACGIVPALSPAASPYDWLVIGIEVNKETLRTKFAKRIDGWLDAGFAGEVKGLTEAGVTKERFQELGFEYTLMQSYIDGTITEAELREQFVQKNWQYAKRQMTWLKRDEEIEWFSFENEAKKENQAAVLARIKEFLGKK